MIRLTETVPIKNTIGLRVVNSKIRVEWRMRGQLVVLDQLCLDIIHLLNHIIDDRPKTLDKFWPASAQAIVCKSPTVTGIGGIIEETNI